MRQEVKLIILVFVLVVAPAIAVSFFAGRVLGSWQIVLQKRMETDAVRIVEQAVAAWEKELGLIGESVSVPSASPGPQAFPRLVFRPWMDGVFIFQSGAGLIYPPREPDASSSEPAEPSLALSKVAVSTNAEVEIQDGRRLLQRPGLDPALGAQTRLRLARAFLSRGETGKALECLGKVAAMDAGPHGDALFPRDPDEGFYYDLVALKRMAELLGSSQDRARAVKTTSELIHRVLARYDDLVPLQRELLVEWIETEIRNNRTGIGDQKADESDARLLEQWRERMRGRRLPDDDRTKLIQGIQAFVSRADSETWIRARVADRDLLLFPSKPSRSQAGSPSRSLAVQFDESRLIPYLNTLFTGITTNTGIRISCRREAAARPESSAVGDVLLAARRLPVPLGSLIVEAYPGDPRAFIANTRLQTRLYRWGGLLLLVSVGAGVWLIWRQAAGEIRQARERSDFAATVSHDLRTPLASMRMLAESLYMGNVGDETKKKKFLGAIIKESDRLSRLTDRALYFIRYGQGALRYQFTEGDLGELVKDVVETFAVSSGCRVQRLGDGRQPPEVGDPDDNQSVIRLSLAPGLPPVRFDGGAIEQVVFNLLDNALKYSDKDKGGRIEVVLSQAGRFVMLSVKDEGVGMTPEDVRRVVKPYARGSDATRHHAKGVGLGLALCHHVVRAHGGRIGIESALGRGSRFSVTLPVAT